MKGASPKDPDKAPYGTDKSPKRRRPGSKEKRKGKAPPVPVAEEGLVEKKIAREEEGGNEAEGAAAAETHHLLPEPTVSQFLLLQHT